MRGRCSDKDCTDEVIASCRVHTPSWCVHLLGYKGTFNTNSCCSMWACSIEVWNSLLVLWLAF